MTFRMPLRRSLLSLTTGMSLILTGTSVAVPKTGHAAPSEKHRHVRATGKPRSQGAVTHPSRPRKTSVQAAEGENIVVNTQIHHTPSGVTGRDVGGGLMKKQTATVAISTVTRDFIAAQSPASSSYELLRMVPGTNVAMSDPYNMQSGNFIVRGLNGDEIGFLMEGAPLNNVGTYVTIPSQYPDGDNVDSESLQPTTVDLTAPMIGAAGGLTRMTLRNPADKFGGQINATFGSYDTYRQSVRIDSGLLGNSGVKFYVGYSHLLGKNWRGPASPYRRDHIDFKLQKDWEEVGTTKLVVAYTDYRLDMLTTPTMSQYRTYGNNYNYSNQFTGTNPTYYKLHGEDAGTLIVSAPTDLSLLNNTLKINVTPYLYHSWGGFAYGATLPNSGAAFYGNTPVTLDMSGLPSHGASTIVNVPTTFDIEHPGINAVASWKHGINTVKAGYWFDYTRQTYETTYGGVSASGSPLSLLGSYSTNAHLKDGTEYKSTNWLTETYTHGLYLGDEINAFNDKLLAEAGVKFVWIHRPGYNYIPGPQSNVGQNAFQVTPQVGFRYQFTPEHQIFLSGNTAFRMPTANSMFNSYNGATGNLLIAGNNQQKNEFSISEEIGYRYTGKQIMATASFFNYNFTNRQISTAAIINGGSVNTFINAGGETGRGVDVEIGTRPWHHFRPYVSGEYLHVTTDNNLRFGNDYLPTAGKIAVRAPKWSASMGLNYDDGSLFGNVNIKYIDSQYSTFMDDESLPAHTNVDLAIGYRFHSGLHLKQPELRLNIQNLAGSTYLSGSNSVTGTAHATRGIHGTMIAGSAPTYYLGAGRAFIGTFSVGF